jgi:hypothetical protein
LESALHFAGVGGCSRKSEEERNCNQSCGFHFGGWTFGGTGLVDGIFRRSLVRGGGRLWRRPH